MRAVQAGRKRVEQAHRPSRSDRVCDFDIAVFEEEIEIMHHQLRRQIAGAGDFRDHGAERRRIVRRNAGEGYISACMTAKRMRPPCAAYITGLKFSAARARQ